MRDSLLGEVMSTRFIIMVGVLDSGKTSAEIELEVLKYRDFHLSKSCQNSKQDSVERFGSCPVVHSSVSRGLAEDLLNYYNTFALRA